MNQNSECYTIPLIIYPFDVLVSIEETDKQLYKHLHKYKHWGDLNDETKEFLKLRGSGRCVIIDQYNLVVIRLIKFPKRSDMMALVSHEVYHATSYIMRSIGMKHEVGVSEEAYAYLNEYIISEIYKKLKL